MQQFGPEWLKPAFDQKFNDLVRQAVMQREIDQLQNRHRELDHLLKSELSQAQHDINEFFDSVTTTLANHS